MSTTNEETFLKNKKLVTPEYVAKLREHILANCQDFFSDSNRADAWCDFVQWPNFKTDRDHLCLPTEPFLVDRNYPSRVGGEHTYCICTVSANRKLTMEVPVIKVSELYVHGWRNGYFLLPILP